MADRRLNLCFQINLITAFTAICFLFVNTRGDIVGCGGFLKSHVPIDFSKVEVKLYTKQGTLKESSDCAPTNGYYFIPIYDKGEYWLKIEPPAGWYFEPKEVQLNFDGMNDPCSKSNDINFTFKGFTIHGKVVSAGSTDGPENISVSLMSQTDNKNTYNALTGKDGYFQFTPIIPADYIIKVHSEKYKFLKNSIRITVKQENMKVPEDSLVVAGYDITGQVLFNGEPTKGIPFVISTNDERSINMKWEGCSKVPLENYQKDDYLCHINSDEKGIFKFQTLPPGNYKIRPHYLKFDVYPEEMNVVLRHAHVTLSEKFVVKGFSVGGRVLVAPGGSGIANVRVHLNGKQEAITDTEGKYNLEDLEPGSYFLSLYSDDLKFEERTVNVSPNAPEMDDVYPSEFKVCGTVKPPSGPRSRNIEIRGSGQAIVLVEAPVDLKTGNFCHFLKPGNYVFKVKISDLEKSTGVQYLPLTREVQVKNQLVTGIDFTMLRGNIFGKIIKLEDSLKAVELSVKLKMKNALVALKILEGNDLVYEFEEILPGFYDVEVQNDRWCFRNEVHSISVTSAKTVVPDFVQTGFQTKISSSHETAVIVTNEEYKKEFFLGKGENVICLPHGATYQLKPKGCHGYDQESFVVDAKSGESLRLEATSHDITGAVVSPHLVDDLTVDVSFPDGRSTKLGPLLGKQESGEFLYKFTIRTKENQNLKFTPHSSSLLMQPDFVELRGMNDCWDKAVKFTGEKGLIVEGFVMPPLNNVKIVLKNIDSAREEMFVTKEDGKYRFGPLRSNSAYEIEAEKESYVFSGPDKDGVFKAHKLAEILVKVMDNSTKEPLEGVLLSLTGGEKYRKNSVTATGGVLTFHSLTPGEYFLRPMMKEYKFEPSSQIIQIREGVTEFIELRGRRVSFSAYGFVTSLNGEAESNVVIEAVGINTCSNLQEEASSELNGQFRIRGLLPQCEYQLRLKCAPDINVRIHRLSPEGVTVKTNQGDVKGIKLIAFQSVEQMDLLVHVESTIPEHLKTLKLKLCRDDSPDSPTYSVRLDTLAGGAKHWGNPSAQERFLKAGILVQLPFVPRDKTHYFIQIESSLNKHTYSYKEPVVHFVADKTYRNFKMTFEPVLKMMDHEFSHSNYFVVPLLLLAGLFYTYFNKAVPLIQNLLGYLNQNSFSFSREERPFYGTNVAGDVSIEPVGLSTKRKTKPRKT